MKWTLKYRLISNWSTWSLSGSQPIEDSHPMSCLSVEPSQDLMLRSTVSFFSASNIRALFAPPLNRGGVIFSLQFVCVSVCVCVCVSVRTFLWTKFQPNGCTDLDAVFAKWLLPLLAQTLLNLVTLGQRSRSQWRNSHFFLHNSLLISLPCISALLSLIKMKFVMSPRYTLGRFVFKFHKNRIGDDVIMTPFKFSLNNCQYLKFYWT